MAHNFSFWVVNRSWTGRVWCSPRAAYRSCMLVIPQWIESAGMVQNFTR